MTEHSTCMYVRLTTLHIPNVLQPLQTAPLILINIFQLYGIKVTCLCSRHTLESSCSKVTWVCKEVLADEGDKVLEFFRLLLAVVVAVVADIAVNVACDATRDRIGVKARRNPWNKKYKDYNLSWRRNRPSQCCCSFSSSITTNLRVRGPTCLSHSYCK